MTLVRAGEAAAGGGDQDEFLILQWQHVEVGRSGQAGGTEQADLARAGSHGLHDVVRDVGDGDVDGDVGMLGGERPHDRGQRLNAGGGGGDDLDPAGGDALDGVDGGAGGVQAAQDPAGRRDEMITGVGGDDAAADAVEQRHSEFAFESGDRLGQRWLGDLQVLAPPG